LLTLERTADDKEWSPARRQERLEVVHAQVETLIRSARASRRDTAIAAWATQVGEGTRQVIEDQSTDYSLEEVDEELQLLAKQGQRLLELLAAGGEAGHARHHQFEQVQEAVLGEVRAQVEGAESWLDKVWGDLYAASTVRRTRAVDTWPAGVAGALAPLLVALERQLPSQGTSNRSMVQPTTEWLVNTFGDLGVSQLSRQASGPARQPESADLLMLLAQTQALTSQSLQQVAEGLTRWMNVEMTHRSKVWSEFSGQVIHYIAWKQEWCAHQQENYPRMQGDTLRRVLVER
jgi:hypothetical protein